MTRNNSHRVWFCALSWSLAALSTSWDYARFTQALQTSLLKTALTRRSAFGYITGAASSTLLLPSNNPAIAQEESTTTKPSIQYENRDRKQNKEALIREDYWYFSGRKPPRRLDIDAFPADDPTWNAWGECTKSESTGNSCVYVSLKQRIPAYGKYAFSISLVASEYGQLGKVLKSSNVNWGEAAKLVDAGGEQKIPSPAVDALLKMALFATQMLTSPNYSGPSRELLVSRYYINECAFALRQLGKALEERDVDTSLALWEFGKDSWSSYLSIVNRSISPKVGDKFQMIS
jgi:hypothetical protein